MATNTKGLDSVVWFLIPRPELDDAEYRTWIDTELIPNWLRQEGNSDIKEQECGDWKKPKHVYELRIGENRIDYFALEKMDSPTDSRGFIISKEFDYPEVIKIHSVADSLERYLQQESIEYSRRNPRRR